MANSRRYHPLVAGDLAAAVNYYDQISIDLGNRFREAIRTRIETITYRPNSFARIDQKSHAAMVDRFPYVVLFEFESTMVTIMGIFHAASDQARWFDRSDSQNNSE